MVCVICSVTLVTSGHFVARLFIPALKSSANTITTSEGTEIDTSELRAEFKEKVDNYEKYIDEFVQFVDDNYDKETNRLVKDFAILTKYYRYQSNIARAERIVSE